MTQSEFEKLDLAETYLSDGANLTALEIIRELISEYKEIKEESQRRFMEDFNTPKGFSPQ